ncbi:DUF4255 domain-containing protein [Aquiflexum sp. TKW24L]|uniref:DUF4255 domain-containing protein n=1 Tax=Aquiflexum sp. TKW24L TaxID=2942212 RepID=UPI0020BDBAD9|nr:DUF4255 domain-containing protein [Aquiflexum sp. TKW24L]MCL6258880.1 DUF4255 domain-containing protein [Aquiflexum sp. TKW24L]
MIDQVLNTVIVLLNDHIGTVEPDVMLGNLSMADSAQAESENSIADRVVVSVVNIQQESTLRNMAANRQVFDNAGLPRGVARNPGVFLNIYLLIGANKSQYNIGLQRISQVISFFQRNSILTVAEIPNLPDFGLEKIIFDLHSTNFEELNQLWGIMGGKYLPSVVYKMRLAYIDSMDEGVEIPLVKTIDAQFNNKNL